MEYIQQVLTRKLGLHERLQQELSTYHMRTVHKDGSIIMEQVKNPYFLVNDTWNVDFLGEIRQFKEMVENYKGSAQNVYFQFTSPKVNLEVKYVWYHRLFKDEWSLGTVFNGQSKCLSKLTLFMNQKYPTLHSLLDLDIEKADREWMFWLKAQGIKTQRTSKHMTCGKYKHKTPVVNFLRLLHSSFFELTDICEEWEKDRWDVRVLHDQYGIDYVKSDSNYYIDFTKIEQVRMRQQVKKYIKQRLLSKNNFSWSTARNYLKVLPKFLSFVFSLEPAWNDLKGLKRFHMEQYIQWMHEYAKSNLTQKNAHPEAYISEVLKIVGKFLEDIQRYEYDIAPEIHVKLLLFPEDSRNEEKNQLTKLIIFLTLYWNNYSLTSMTYTKKSFLPCGLPLKRDYAFQMY